jgi:hypothetical protein
MGLIRLLLLYHFKLQVGTNSNTYKISRRIESIIDSIHIPCCHWENYIYSYFYSQITTLFMLLLELLYWIRIHNYHHNMIFKSNQFSGCMNPSPSSQWHVRVRTLSAVLRLFASNDNHNQTYHRGQITQLLPFPFHILLYSTLRRMITT